MQLNKENIKELKKGQQLYIAYQTKSIERVKYLGKYEDYYYFGQHYNPDFYYLYSKNIDESGNNNGYRFILKNVYTSYEEAIKKQREMFCNLINHFNKHQFKTNPIVVQPERLSEETTYECETCKQETEDHDICIITEPLFWSKQYICQSCLNGIKK